MTKFRALLVTGLVCLAARPAPADSLADGIRDVLDDIQKQVDDARVWKLHVKPTFSESVVWTDNVFLNDSSEQPFRLIGVQTPTGFIGDPTRLQRIQGRVPDFQDVESEGRVSDTIIKTRLGVNLDLPLNDRKTKLFKTKRMRVLSVTATNSEYVTLDELDNTSFTVNTDIFGFLADLIPALEAGWGNHLWVRAGVDYSRLDEPLDTVIVELQQVAILSTQFNDFERTTHTVRLDAGYDANKFDVEVGGAWHRMRLDDDELRQAEFDRYSGHVEAGLRLPQIQGKRVFARYSMDYHNPGDRAGANGDVQALNSGDLLRAVVGAEGSVFSKKLTGRAEVGYLAWQSDDDGVSGDRTDLNVVTGKLLLAWKPWSQKKTKFQFSYEQTADSSAIANFNAIHRGTVSMTHHLAEAVKLDVSLGVTRTDASEGPNSRLFDVGAGLTYKLAEQADVTLRYLFRYAESHEELVIDSSFNKGRNKFIFISHSDGDFYQNVVQLGLNVRF